MNKADKPKAPELVLAEEAVAEWRRHPVTQAFLRHLQSQRRSRMEQWAAGGLVDEDLFKSAVKQAAAARECQVLAQLVAFDAQDLVDTEQASEDD